ncbi:MAG: hypothetical protein KBD37_07295, partial [Burkholderiales bacterium]|nr:hypothetical protein [Burkholderiales bacterium]
DSTGIIYAGTANGKVLEYSTVHPTWTILATSLQAAVSSVVTSNGHVYVGTKSQGSNDGQVFEYDNGTWAQLSNFTNGSVLAIAADVSHNLYAATGSGQVFEYTSNSWANLESPITGLNTLAVTASGQVYAGTSAGEVLNYTGASWAVLGDGTLDGTPINSIAVSTNGAVYAGTAGPSNAGPGQVFKYESPTWAQLDNLAPSSNNGFVVSLNVSDSENVYVGIGNASNNGNMLQYSNAAPYWTVIGNNSLDETPITSLAIDGLHNFYAGTTNGGVFKFIDGNESWAYLGSPDGSQLVTVTSLAVNNDGSAIYAGDFYSNVWVYTGESWALVGDLASEVASEIFPSVNLTLDKNGHLYAGTNPLVSTIGTVWEYNTLLESWTQLSGSGTSGSLDNSKITSLATDNDGNLYASTSGNPEGEVFKYSRSNAAWSLVGSGSLDGSSVNSVTTDNNNILYAGTNNGNVYTYSEISGFWIQIGTNSSLNSVPIVTLTMDGSNNLYAATSSNTTFGTLWKYNSSTALWDNTDYTNGASFYGLAYLAVGIK